MYIHHRCRHVYYKRFIGMETLLSKKAAGTGVNNVGCVTKKWKSSEVRVTGKMSQKSKAWEGFRQLIIPLLKIPRGISVHPLCGLNASNNIFVHYFKF